MAYRRSNSMTRFKYYMQAHDRATREGPYARLVFECRTYAAQTSPDYTSTYHGHRTDPAKVINGYLSHAIRRGLRGDQVRCALAEAGLSLPEGVMSVGRLFALELGAERDTWLRYWCNVMPRVLVSASRGKLTEPLAGRTYTDDELKEVAALCVTAQAENVEIWISLQRWAIDELYPEYERRKGQPHACADRVSEAAWHYPEW